MLFEQSKNKILKNCISSAAYTGRCVVKVTGSSLALTFISLVLNVNHLQVQVNYEAIEGGRG